jgi:hypothetical protein
VDAEDLPGESRADEEAHLTPADAAVGGDEVAIGERVIEARRRRGEVAMRPAVDGCRRLLSERFVRSDEVVSLAESIERPLLQDE